MRSHVVALGLGSNLQAPIENLRRALNEIKNIHELKVVKLSSIYESDAQLPENATAAWNHQYLNAVVLCEVKSSLYPNQLLKKLKEIEKRLGRQDSAKWAPRLIDIDILLWDHTVYVDDDLKIPHPQIKERPFVLLPLLEVWPELPGEKPNWALPWVLDKPFNTKKSDQHFWPKMVGILNVTEDSFSDGGQFNRPEALLLQAQRLLKTGATVLDIGAESTRPGAKPIEPAEEVARLKSALSDLKTLQNDFEFEISLDCRNPEVVAALLGQFAINYLNDVTGFQSSAMRGLLEESPELKAFVMHSLTVPPSKNEIIDPRQNPNETLTQWWQQKLIDLEFASDRIIFDPGIGFGKSKWQNLYILRNLHQLSSVRQPIMIGHSRKSFLTLLCDRPAPLRDLETALVTKDLNLTYVQYLRVHDVESQRIALRSQQ